MLGPFSNTLEDRAKHKVGELGYIPLFPTSQGPLEWCHQLINEHKGLSFSPSPSLSLSNRSLHCLGAVNVSRLLRSFCLSARTCAPYEVTSS